MQKNNKNVIWHVHPINRFKREEHHGHKSIVLWFTGLSGSGKSTIAGLLEEKLHQLSVSTYLLDGDNVRCGLCKDLSFSDKDRKENIRRVAEVAKLMIDAGILLLASFISPYRAERQLVRNMLGETNFIEIFIDTPLEICEMRDPKGLYKKARSGEISNFTGINSIYELPNNPDVHIDGQKLITDTTTDLLDLLRRRNIITF